MAECEDHHGEVADDTATLFSPEHATMNPVASWEGATILADADDDLVGTTLDNTYLVERILGEGGMGRVYQAAHTRIAQKRVAVKVLHPEYMRNAEMLARFQREAEAAASIAHPNVVAVYDVDRTPRGLPYLICEYLEGMDLWEHLKQQKRLSLPTAIHIVRQLCEGLRAAHRSGVVHRDLKPQNIFLVGEFAAGVPEFPFIKILDFGLSKFMDVADGELVTKTGVIMGTPSFMSPEQALGQHADLRADVYGVGAILYTCMTGRLPFEELTPQATILAVIGNEPTRPRVLVPSIPEYAELVIQRAMAKQPAERYPDMDALLSALEPLVEDRKALHDLGAPRSGRQSLDTQAESSSAARPKLVFFLVLALGLLLGSVAVAVVGIEQVADWSLSRLELGLVLTCAVAVAVTPTVLIVRRIRSLVWDNTSRVLGLLSRVRVAVLTAIVTYGLAWFGFRVFDGVVLRLMGEPIRANLTWPGWDLLLPVVGMGAGAVALLRERALSEMLRGRWSGRFVVGIALLATLTLAAVVIPLGLRWQARESSGTSLAPIEHRESQPAESPAKPEQTAAASNASAATPVEPTPTPADTPKGVAETPSSSASSSPPPVALASKEELTAAAALGVDGWSSLADHYPTDPRVLRALVLSHASRAAELGNAMVVARRLFKVAPEETKSADMQYLVQRAAETPGVPADVAWKMMTEEMGTQGPDVLYSLIMTKPKLAERAERALSDPTVRRRGSPALAIAWELRTASSCAARLPLLDRAIQIGDERAIAVLGALSSGTGHGCGKNKRKPCPPACPEQVDAFRAAMTKLSQRLKSGG